MLVLIRAHHIDGLREGGCGGRSPEVSHQLSQSVVGDCGLVSLSQSLAPLHDGCQTLQHTARQDTLPIIILRGIFTKLKSKEVLNLRNM